MTIIAEAMKVRCNVPREEKPFCNFNNTFRSYFVTHFLGKLDKQLHNSLLVLEKFQ